MRVVTKNNSFIINTYMLKNINFLQFTYFLNNKTYKVAKSGINLNNTF